jgi:hypothetical protein
MLGHQLQYAVIFSFGPSTLDQVWVEHFLPPMEALYIGSIREKLRCNIITITKKRNKILMSLLQCNQLLQWNSEREREREREREPSGHNKKVVEVTLNEAGNKNTHQSSSSFYPCAIAQLAARPHPGPIHPTHISSKPLNEPTNQQQQQQQKQMVLLFGTTLIHSSFGS